MIHDALIVGADHVGAQAAIALLGEESDVPYARPPLSKD